jgi:hypothetical protein
MRKPFYLQGYAGYAGFYSKLPFTARSLVKSSRRKERKVKCQYLVFKRHAYGFLCDLCDFAVRQDLQGINSKLKTKN